MSKKLKRSTSKKSKKSSSGNLCTAINYKLSQEEIDSLLEIKPNKKDLNNVLNKKQKSIIDSILKKGGIKLKILDFGIFKLTNKKPSLFGDAIYKDTQSGTKNLKTSINIFLDVNPNLKNKGAELFYKEKSPKNLSENNEDFFKPLKLDEAILEGAWLPKTGDIIKFSSNTFHKVSNIREKNPFKKKKNRFYLEIHLGSKKKKSKKKSKKKI